MKQRGYIGLEQAILKIRNYCAYQERSHQEVRDKLISFGLYDDQIDEVVSGLIQENFLNEERYAIAFAGGKFRVKGWGKVKIRHALRLQKVSDFCIRKGLNAIDDDAYLKTLKKLFDEKQKSLRSEKNMFIKMRKIRLFLQQRGYESELIQEVMKSEN